jgi:3-methyladenine DNA glycosylase AlkD
MERYCVELERQMKVFANKDLAVWQRKYMRNKFKFLGVPASDRNFVIKDFLKKNGLPDENNFENYL